CLLLRIFSNVWSTSLEIRVQDDAIAGFAGFESGEGLVDLAHGEVLGLRGDVVAGGEVEHGGDGDRGAGGGAGDGALLFEQGEGGDGDGFEDCADDVEAAVGGQGVDHGVPVERDVDGADQEVEAAGELLDGG